MASKYCKECLRKAKGKTGPRCVCGAEWSVCKNKRIRAGIVTRMWNKRTGNAPKAKPRYSEYLESDLWKTIRAKVLLRDGCICRVCRSKAIVVHHRNYNTATMSGDDLDSLISLCKSCHKRVHRDESGKRLGVRDTEANLVRMLQ